MKTPISYVVQVFQSPHWVDVLSTKDKEKAEAALKPLGKAGRIVEVKPKA